MVKKLLSFVSAEVCNSQPFHPIVIRFNQQTHSHLISLRY